MSIDKNEQAEASCSAGGIKHNLLNAKNHEREAEIVAQAGKLGRGDGGHQHGGPRTDIMLGSTRGFLAKNDLRKAGLSDEMNAEATAYAETTDEEILSALAAVRGRSYQKHKEEIRRGGKGSAPPGDSLSSAPSGTTPAAIDNQLRAAPTAGDPARPGST